MMSEAIIISEVKTLFLINAVVVVYSSRRCGGGLRLGLRPGS
jgi:hypothetical protein